VDGGLEFLGIVLLGAGPARAIATGLVFGLAESALCCWFVVARTWLWRDADTLGTCRSNDHGSSRTAGGKVP
jgi:hypothetical protein